MGARATVVSVAALPGATSTAVHAVDVRDARGAVHALVLRRYVLPWVKDEPEAPAVEAAALEIATACSVPTPELVAVADDVAGAPASLVTRLEGEPDPAPDLPRLAALLPAIHATPLPSNCPLPPYRPYAREALRRRSELWERAFAILEGPIPDGGERVFLHRDFHPGNVLWSGGVVSGVVDWVNARVGPPDADVGHARMDLARLSGLEAADTFLTEHRRLTGRGPYDPYFDLAAALGGFDDADLDARSPAEIAFVERAAEACLRGERFG